MKSEIYTNFTNNTQFEVLSFTCFIIINLFYLIIKHTIKIKAIEKSKFYLFKTRRAQFCARQRKK